MDNDEQATEQSGAEQSTESGQVSGAQVAASMGQQPPDGATGGLQPDAIRESPEYKELQRQNRELARQNGTMRAEAERQRQQAEAARQAAEAEQVRVMQQQMQETLGDRAGDFAAFAQLLQDDPVAAAQRFAAIGQAQSVTDMTTPTGGQQQEEDEDTDVSDQQQPPQAPRVPTPSGMSVGAAPLGQPSQQQTRDQRIEELDQQYDNVVQQNQSLQSRTRVTQRLRDVAMGAFLRRSYIAQHDIDPELVLPQRNPR